MTSPLDPVNFRTQVLKFLFNRESRVVRFLEIAGVIGLLLFLKIRLPAVDLQTGLALFLFAGWLFIRICDWIKWYPDDQRSMGVVRGRAGSPPDFSDGSGFARPARIDIGIEVHFRKALVPTSYILAVTALFGLVDLPVLTTALLIFAGLLMGVLTSVNGILIYFHLRDKDPLPVNYFSRNKYLHDEIQKPAA